MDYFFGAVIVIIEMISFVNLAECFFVKKESKNKIYTRISFNLLVLLSLLILNCFSWNIVIKNILLIVALIVFLSYLYEGNLYKKSVIPVFFLAIISAIDFTVVFGIRAWWEISQEQAIQSPVFFVFGVIISRFTLFLLSYLAKRLNFKNTQCTQNNPKEWAIITVFLISTLINLYLLFDVSINTNRLDTGVVIAAVSIIFTTIGIFEITLTLEKEKKKEDFELLESKIEFEMQKVSSAMDLYNNQRKLTHDFKEHLNALATLIKSNNFLKADNYISDLLKIQEQSSLVIYSNNPIIDMLLTQKSLEAKKTGTEIDFEVGDLTHFPMAETDIVVVLANLLDNAIEASKDCEIEKNIFVTINLNERQNILKIKNSMSKNINIVHGEIKTTKKNKAKHGFGLSNVKEIFDRYDWKHIINIEDNTFEFIAIQLK